MKKKQVPANMVRTQKTQRQLVPDTEIYPETRGARAGPANGATVKNARAFPRAAAFQMSDTRAPLFARGAAAKTPPRKRKTRIDAVFFAKAHPTWKPWKEVSKDRRGDVGAYGVDDKSDEEDGLATVLFGEGAPQ